EHLAFCGYHGMTFSIKRQQAFEELANARRLSNAHIYGQPAVAGAAPVPLAEQFLGWDEDHLKSWLKGLPKPVGIVACNDTRGRQILEACFDCGIHVPSMVAVVGVDNDRAICELSSPTLSSVIPNVD